MFIVVGVKKICVLLNAMDVAEKYGLPALLFAVGFYFSRSGQFIAAIITFGIATLYLLSNSALINPNVRGGDEFIGQPCNSTKDCGPGRKVFCVPKIDHITGKVTKQGVCRAVATSRCQENTTCRGAGLPTTLSSTTSSHCFSNNCLQSREYSYVIRTLFSKAAEINVGPDKFNNHPCITHHTCKYRHRDKYRTKSGSVCWPNGVHLGTGFAISSVDQAVYLDKQLKTGGFMHIPSIASMKASKDKSVRDDPNITWEGSVGTVTFPNGAKSVIAPKGSGTGFLTYSTDKFKPPDELAGKYNIWISGKNDGYAVPVAGIINEELVKAPKTVSVDVVKRHFKTGTWGWIFGTPTTHRLFSNMVRKVPKEHENEKQYINFATDPVTLKMLEKCEKTGCGFGVPSSLRQSGQLWFFQPTCGAGAKPCAIELK